MPQFEQHAAEGFAYIWITLDKKVCVCLITSAENFRLVSNLSSYPTDVVTIYYQGYLLESDGLSVSITKDEMTEEHSRPFLGILTKDLIIPIKADSEIMETMLLDYSQMGVELGKHFKSTGQLVIKGDRE